MQPHVDMINVFSSGLLTQIMISCILRFLEGVCNLISPLTYLVNGFLCFITVEMDKAPSELHYRGDDQGTLAIVADG
jgi:hypothetical protein